VTPDLVADALTAADAEQATDALRARRKRTVSRVAEVVREGYGAVVAFGDGRVVSTPWLDTDEAAAYVRSTTQALYKLVQGGKMPFHRRHGVLLFDTHELDAWIRSQDGRVVPTPKGWKGRHSADVR
jgi:excisionase family DNA binding protein